MNRFTQLFSAAIVGGVFAVSSAAAQTRSYTDGVFMLNEGNYGTERATINFLGSDGQWQYRLPITLDGSPIQLGTTGCCAVISGDNMYIVSKKMSVGKPDDDDPTLVVCDARTMQGKARINSITTDDGTAADGRAFLPVPELGKGYLSTTDGIYAVSLESNTVLGRIEGTGGLTNNQTGNMLWRDGMLYAVDQQRGLLVIKTAAAGSDTADELVKTVNGEPEGGTYCSIVESKDGSIWLTAGTAAGATADHIVKFDPSDCSTESVSLPDGVYPPTNPWGAWNPDCFTASATENAIFWNGATGAWSNGQHIYKFDTATRTTKLLLDFTTAAAPQPYAYGAACRVNPDNGLLYLSVTLGSAWGNESELRIYDTTDATMKESYPMEANYWFPELPVFALKGTNAISAADAPADVHETARYSIDGKRLQKPQRGLNIVKYSDGTVKKILVK